MKHPLTRYVLDIERGAQGALKITRPQLLESLKELQEMPQTPIRQYFIQEINRKLK